jgi:cyanophycin synthetase
MLKNRLLEKGVSATAIEMISDEQEAATRALELCEHGDLLLVLADNIKRTWKQIIYFNSGAKAEASAKKTVAANRLPESESFELDSSLELISDERGVRIAREEAD